MSEKRQLEWTHVCEECRGLIKEPDAYDRPECPRCESSASVRELKQSDKGVFEFHCLDCGWIYLGHVNPCPACGGDELRPHVPIGSVDEAVPYVRDVSVRDTAEDVKTMVFVGESTAVEVGITDEVMVRFMEAAEEVYDSIHADMSEMRETFRDAEGDDDA